MIFDQEILEMAIRNVYMSKFQKEIRELLAFSKSQDVAAVFKEYERLMTAEEIKSD